MRDTKPNLNNNLFEQFTGDTLSLSGDTDIYGELEVKTGGVIKINDDIEVGRRLQHLGNSNTYLEFTTDKINLTIGDNNIINLQDSNVVRVNGVIEISGSTVKISNNGSDGMVLDDVTGTYNLSGLTDSGITGATNGLCVNDSVVSLGGVLTGDTSICGAASDFCFGTAASKLETFCIESNTDVWNTNNKFNLGNGFGVSVSGESGSNSSCIAMSLNGDALCLTTTNSGNLQKIAFLGGGIRVESSCYGLCYLSDYSANYVARSIPDAEWVSGLTHTYSGVTDGNLASFDSSSGITDSGISSETVVYDLTDFIIISGTTANTDTVIPAKFRLVSIVFNETSGNAAGDISVGITSGGTDIINAETVGASALIDGAIGTSIFSTSSSQLIYITSSAWGSGVVDTYIRMEKFIE